MLGVDLLYLPSFHILQRGSNRMGQRIITVLKFLYHRAPFNIRVVSQEISNVYSLNLSLSNGVNAAVLRIVLKGWSVDQFLAIFVYRG